MGEIDLGAVATTFRVKAVWVGAVEFGSLTHTHFDVSPEELPFLLRDWIPWVSQFSSSGGISTVVRKLVRRKNKALPIKQRSIPTGFRGLRLRLNKV